ncbi:DUF309 domain-containing protein [Halobacteriales archaeon SW_10_68_16]|nr:MAG: DUF309 domain-containing protein [Halobacteriales archaeon SW_10_68_16]
MEPHLRAGVAIYNAGGHHAAHDAWEDHWLGLDAGTDDERFLHGLIQFTAAVYHARNRNWSGATGLAEGGPAGLGFEATCVAADVLAEEGYDEETIERAVTFARADLDAGKSESPFVTFLFDFVREPEDRSVVFQRLADHVGRRTGREADVEGLFE